MTWVRPAYMALAWLFVLGVAIQFFLAGLGMPELGGESFEAHRQWGFITLHIIPILMFVAALGGRMGRKYIGWTLVLFVLVLFQPLWVGEGFDPRWLTPLHVLIALLIFALGHWLAQESTRMVRAEGRPVAQT